MFFRPNRSEYETNLKNKRDELREKKELLEKTMTQIDSLEREGCEDSQRSEDIKKTIVEADKALARILGSANLLKQVLSQEMGRHGADESQ